MRKTLLTLLILFCTFPLFAQDNGQPKEKKSWFKRLFEMPEIIHDTIYIVIDDYPTEEEKEEEEELEVESGGSIPMPVDTLNTYDKFQKVILFDNGTWAYYEIPRPDVPDFISNDHWMTEQVHAYNDVNPKDIPEEVDLVLCDSLHSWHIPAVGRIVSKYKMRKGHKHQGIDIGAGFGSPIYAAFDGIVRVALPPRMTGGYGNVVVLRHANGLETYYGHLTQFIVDVDDLVKAGEVIGYCGSTGRSTGPHLHFETRYMGQSFDPERIFDFEEEQLRDTVFTLKRHYFSIYSHEGQTDKESIAANDRVVYTIKKGDTLGSIAKKYGTTVKQLCKLNNISETKTLSIGQKIIVR